MRLCQTGEAVEASSRDSPNPFPAGALRTDLQDALITTPQDTACMTCRVMDSVLPLEPFSNPSARVMHPSEIFAGQVLRLSRPPIRSEIQHLFDLLPKERPPRGDASGRAFACGMYCQGPLQGLRANSRRHPLSSKLLASFVRSLEPSFNFSSLHLFLNVKTSPHIDSNNAPLPNLIAGISDFKDGQVLVENPSGEFAIETEAGPLPAICLGGCRHLCDF